MSRVRVVTDSAAALPSAVARTHDVTVVPLRLTSGGGSRPDAPAGDPPAPASTTAAPAPGEWIDAFTSRPAPGGVVAVTVAGSMSAAHVGACAAARAAGGRVRVLDSGTAAAGQALVVLAAARRAAAGASLDQVLGHAAAVAGRVRLVATLSSLEHLARSGRVPRAAAEAGRALRVNPVFEFRQGSVRRRRPALSRDAAVGRVCRAVAANAPAEELSCLRLAAMAPLDGTLSGDRLVELVRRALAPAARMAQPLLCEPGEVIVSHTGPTVAGVAWWWEPPV